MPGRDFFDGDLYARREELPRVKVGPADEPPPPEGVAGPDAGRSVSDLNLPLMVRHKQALDEQDAQRTQELERLRRIAADLEREKREIEEARATQESFLRGRQELLDRLTQSVVTIERRELQAVQTAELLQAARQRFRAMLDEIQAIREEEWTEETIREKLKEALARVDDLRMEYNKTMAKIEAALGSVSAEGGAGGSAPLLRAEPIVTAPAARPDRTLREWFVIGLMVSLPAIITAVILVAVLIARGLMF
ncbi:MAG: hypothetical protein N2652_02000 [Kiritimatiellae bacterium]|nr:hypothetical protein [Kiritimatiellia bacterium]